MTGCVFKIQRFSIHDGSGIRTTVFLKGCPLSCWWCHNPESQSFEKQLSLDSRKCIGCGACAEVCPSGVISGASNYISEKCIRCGACAEVCPTGAIKMIGEDMTPEQVVKEVLKDTIFFDESGGGVTFSGGEPMSSIDFLYETAKILEQHRISITIDTCGYAPWEHFERILPYVDTFLYDIKLMDEEKHVKYTGVSNKLILSSLEKLAKTGADIIARIPIITGINDDPENIGKMGEFLKKNGIRDVCILPYHNIGEHKYAAIGMEYKLADLPEPKAKDLEKIKEILERYGLSVKIGG